MPWGHEEHIALSLMTKIIELIGSMQLINLTSMSLWKKKQKMNHKKETCDLQDNFLDYVSTY